MSVKSLKRQLMAAIAMVLVAAIALSSATYAWFVNNAQVTATNVNVQAATAYSLLISPKTGTDATWGTTTALASTLGQLTPVSTIGEVNNGKNDITLSAASSDKAAVGIGDGTSVKVGDVRFVTNTKWESNYVTGVSEVSKTSKVSGNTYFYSDTVYLKTAQAGNIYLDSTGIGIVWAKYDESKTSKFADAKLISLKDFAALTTITTTNLNTTTTPKLADAEAYNEKLTSAQALLKTMRVGLLVSQTSGETTTRTWHEYQLATANINSTNAVNTTVSSTSGADGITKAVSVGTGTPTNATPTVADIKNVSTVTMTSKTIEDYAITGSQSTIAEFASSATPDKIAAVAVNEEVQVDIYIWMEGCDYDTVAANITSFSGTGVSGLQLGFCLGTQAAASVTTTPSN
jgi:hypothetical protein